MGTDPVLAHLKSEWTPPPSLCPFASMSAELEKKIADAQGRAEAFQDTIRRQKEQKADTTCMMIA